MVMPRDFSSGRRSVSVPVRAWTSAVLPWSMWPAVPRTTERAAADFMAPPARALVSEAEREGHLLRAGWSAGRAGRGPRGCARRPEDRGGAWLTQTLFPRRERAEGPGRSWPAMLRE